MDDLEDDLAELEISAKCMPAPTKPPNMITDSKPIDIQTAMVGTNDFLCNLVCPVFMIHIPLKSMQHVF